MSPEFVNPTFGGEKGPEKSSLEKFFALQKRLRTIKFHFAKDLIGLTSSTFDAVEDYIETIQGMHALNLKSFIYEELSTSASNEEELESVEDHLVAAQVVEGIAHHIEIMSRAATEMKVRVQQAREFFESEENLTDYEREEILSQETIFTLQASIEALEVPLNYFKRIMRKEEEPSAEDRERELVIENALKPLEAGMSDRFSSMENPHIENKVNYTIHTQPDEEGILFTGVVVFERNAGEPLEFSGVYNAKTGEFTTLLFYNGETREFFTLEP